ncbi:MAG: GNAT family N-acetyltransferase [bacterium]|jgi:ribosomal-protein-alanine N-acetyltransferase
MELPVLHTPRLTLRPVGPRDEDALWPYLSDPETCRYMSWEAHRTRADTQAFLKRVEEDWRLERAATWSLDFNGKLVGIISLIAILRSHRALIYHRAELAYWLGKEFRGTGLMTEACRTVIDCAFDELGIHRLVVGHFDINHDSKRLIERLGFRYIGNERDAFCKNGVWHTMKSYDLLASDPRPTGQFDK